MKMFVIPFSVSKQHKRGETIRDSYGCLKERDKENGKEKRRGGGG